MSTGGTTIKDRPSRKWGSFFIYISNIILISALYEDVAVFCCLFWQHIGNKSYIFCYLRDTKTLKNLIQEFKEQPH